MANMAKIPGTYITEQKNAALTTVFDTYRSVGLIASGFTTLNKLDIAVVRGSTDTDIITGFSASEIKSILCVSSYIEAYGTRRAQYIAAGSGVTDPDYSWTAGANGDKITWVSGHGPEVGDTYYVSITFEKQDDTYYLPTEFTSLQELQDAYGPEYNASTGEINKISVLGRMLFNAGAPIVYACQLKPTAATVSFTVTAANGEDAGTAVVTLDSTASSAITIPASATVNEIATALANGAPAGWIGSASTATVTFTKDTYAAMASTDLANNKVEFTTATATISNATVSQYTNASLSTINAALANFEEISVQYMLCGENQVSGANGAVMQHCVNMSATENSLLRTCVVAPATIIDSVNDYIANAQTYKTQFVTNIAPSQCLIAVSDVNGNTYEKWVSSIYVGAALLGMAANPSRRLTQPLTRQFLYNYGILDIDKYYKKQEIMKLAGAGLTVLVLQKETGYVYVNQGLTTDPSNYANYYLNVVWSKLELVSYLQSQLDAAFIGTELTTDAPMNVQSYTAGLLDSQIGILMNGYRNLSVTQNATDPAALDVYVEVLPTFALDYIYIRFKVVTNTANA